MCLMACAAILVVGGCDSASSSGAVEKLRLAQENMESVSTEFADVLKEVVDEASAEAAKPKLNAISKKMVDAGKDLELAMNTKSRLAMGIKKKVNDFRREQKVVVDDQVRRIKNLPSAKLILDDILKKISTNPR